MTDETASGSASASTLTSQQQTRLTILDMLQYDTAAAQEAIDGIGDDPLKLELFKRQYTLAQSETTALARTIKALKGMKDALSLFD